MDSKKRAYYEHPLQHADAGAIRRERMNQCYVAAACIVIGIMASLLSTALNGYGERTLQGRWYWAGIVMVCIGLYRLVRLRHYTAKGLRQNLIRRDGDVRSYDEALRRQKLDRRQQKWYNKSIVSDRAIMTVLVTLFAVVLLVVFGLTLFVVLRQGK